MRVRRFSVLMLAVGAMTLSACAAPEQPAESTAPADPIEQYQDDWAAYMISCMKDAGFEVTTDGEGGVGADFIPTEQIDPYNAAEAQCLSTAPTQPPVDETMARALYQEQIATAECLEKEGVDTGDPPSEDSWVEDIIAGDQVWTAYGRVSTDPAADIPALLEVCPQPGSR